LGYLANGEEVFEENFSDSSLPLRENKSEGCLLNPFLLFPLHSAGRVRVRGAVNFFTPTSILPRQWGGRILRNSFNFSLLSPCGRE
jgi:hypothetical protein